MATGQSDAESAIRALSDGFARGVNAGDAEWLVREYYAEDAYFLPPNHRMVNGRSGIRAFLRALFEAGVGGLAIETTKIEASGDLAYHIGRFTMGNPSPDRGKFVEVYRRQADGSWKCVGDIFNSDDVTA
jgi:uncharacterized protein (TIGR02246 family)